LITQSTDPISTRNSRKTEAKELLRKRPIFRLLLALAVGFSVGSSDAGLKCQEPAQGSKSDLSASASKTPATTPPQPVPSDEYRINPEDVLDVYVFDSPDISHEYTVNTAGTITIPLLTEPVKAAGLSPEQLSRAIEENFRNSGRLRHPEITVSVKQSRRSVVIVEGAVRNPQVVQVIGRTKLLFVLTEAGGVSDDAGNTVTITRSAIGLRDSSSESGSAPSTAVIDLKQLIDGNIPGSNIDIFPGDRVTVERAGLVYVLGQVGRPGGYVLRSRWEHLTVLEVLAIAGDVTNTAKKSKAVIIREDPKAQNGRVEIALNLRDIVTGRSPDRPLLANDILYVPGSAGKRALHTLATVPVTVMTTAADLAIYRP
jgi:polysaccharide export outer membrane protein